MTILKTILFLSSLTYSSFIFSQIDIKSNPVAWVFGEFGASCEYSYSERISGQLGIYVGQSLNDRIINGIADINTFKRKGLKIVPSFRYYLAPGFEPTSGGYVEFYTIFESMKSYDIYARDVPVDKNGLFANYPNIVEIKDSIPYIIKSRKIGLGGNYGYKFVFDSGFIFDFLMGFRIDPVDNNKFKNIELTQYVERLPTQIKDSKVYFNFGAVIGWRF